MKNNQIKLSSIGVLFFLGLGIFACKPQAQLSNEAVATPIKENVAYTIDLTPLEVSAPRISVITGKQPAADELPIAVVVAQRTD